MQTTLASIRETSLDIAPFDVHTCERNRTKANAPAAVTQLTLAHRYLTVTLPLQGHYSTARRPADAWSIAQAKLRHFVSVEDIQRRYARPKRFAERLQLSTKIDMLVFIVSFEMNEAPTKNARDVHRCVVKEGFYKPGFTLPNRIHK